MAGDRTVLFTRGPIIMSEDAILPPLDGTGSLLFRLMYALHMVFRRT